MLLSASKKLMSSRAAYASLRIPSAFSPAKPIDVTKVAQTTPFLFQRVADTRMPRMSRREPTAQVEELQELHVLCRQGRLYEVERWIGGGRPLQSASSAAARGHYRSALRIALETGQHSLCDLLLRNGYCLDLERDSPLNVALGRRRWDLIDLLLEYGADPHRTDLTTLFDTYRLELFERFLALGVDLASEHELAQALAYHTRNKPLLSTLTVSEGNTPRVAHGS